MLLFQLNPTNKLYHFQHSLIKSTLPFCYESCCFNKYILLIMLLQLSHFFSHLFPSTLYTPPPIIAHPLSSCPWIIHISSLASPFPILFLTSACVFCTYHLCFLFPVLFPPYFLLPFITDNPPCDLHFCDTVSVLVVCLVCFIFVFHFFRFSC